MKLNNILTLAYISSFFLFSCHSTKDVNLNKTINATKDQIENKEVINYKNKVFDTNIKTVLCHKKDEEQSLAIMNLDTQDKLLISFDDLNADRENYYYTIIHCNSDWNKSDLMQSEYIDGFTNEPISNYEFSFNTIQRYIHYEFEFPSKNMKPIISGNYIFKIYDENKNTILHKRFMVLDNKTNIYANITRATLADYRNTKHEINFTVEHPRLVVKDPFSDIKVHIKQNNREDNTISDLKPKFVRNNELIYNYNYDNTFWANNEFRHFDFKSLRYQSERVRRIDFDSTYNHVYLFIDEKRTFDRYCINPDINGRFLIKSQEAWKTSIEADYAFVHFTLLMHNITYGDLYLLGEFSDWQVKEDFKLEYNTKQNLYEADIYLKQGYYNYHYALNDTSTNRVDVSFIEGTHYQTRNDYYIYVYHRGIGDRYEKLVGFLKTSSKELF
mgnify:CR=1 FL=1